MQTGTNECGWVRMGALGYMGHGEHKIRAGMGYLGSHRSGFRYNRIGPGFPATGSIDI